MNFGQISSFVLVVFLLVLSGIADARSFIHVSRMWKDDELVLRELGLAIVSVAIANAIFFLSVRLLARLGVVSAEIQTIIYFSITIIGVAIISGTFTKWDLVDQSVAAIVCIGICWLLIKTES